MSLHYLLDGYNIIHQIPALISKKLEHQRDSLIQLIETKRPQGSAANKLTVIFDGKSDVFGGHKDCAIGVVFSKDGSADEVIKEMVRSALNKKTIIVVSDDNELCYCVRAQGAKICSVSEFLLKLHSKERIVQRSNGDDAPNRKYIPKTLETRINEELKKIWLQDKDKKDV